MRFKLEYTIREMPIPKKSPLTFAVKHSHNINVEIRCPNKEDEEKGHSAFNAFATAELDLEVSEKINEVFKKIENNRFEVTEANLRQSYTDQHGETIRLPGIDQFPGYFNDFIRQINKELREAIRLVIDAVRWRTNTLGPHNPISSRGMFWSRDKDFWNPVPSQFEARFSMSSTIHITDKIYQEIKFLVGQNYHEPVHHHLFREAWGQRSGNPRSSLLIGLSALEVAIKESIAELIPNASWLVDNIPTPPVTRLLTEYLPTLPVENMISGRVYPPPPEVIDKIKKAVSIRNRVAHVGGEPPGSDLLDELLEAIHDTIWLLDYYCGHKWALNHISDITRANLER
ncbi:MAG: hypothetical protein OEZ39_05450 [Gammaproteobacteria bacterium]|nr:hypothetical protein [Gammaproteobacteria bacterium]